MYQLKHHKYLSQMIKNHIYYKYHCDISPRAVIPSSVRFPHPIGIVIGGDTVIGNRCVIFQNVTFGAKFDCNGNEVFPVVEDNCRIYPNSCVIGNIIVKQGCVVGAGSIVTKSTEENGTYYGVAATIHGYNYLSSKGVE